MSTNSNEVSESLNYIARSLSRLGLNNAATDMGALELLSKGMSEDSEQVAMSLGGISSSLDDVSTSLDGIAAAIRYAADLAAEKGVQA